MCDIPLAAVPRLPHYDVACPGCGSSLWCQERVVDGVSVLLILPDRTPDYPDVSRLVQALARGPHVPRVAVELSSLDYIRSGLMAQLILLQKQVQAAQGRLALCELSPLVREVFRRTCIDTLFEIRESLADAVRSIRPQADAVYQPDMFEGAGCCTAALARG